MKKYGIVIADEYEYEPFVKTVEQYDPQKSKLMGKQTVKFDFHGAEVAAILCGIGKVNAASATSYIICCERCDTILNIGLSGAISGFSKGDVVAGISFVECDFDLSPFGLQVGQKPQNKYVYEPDKRLLDLALSINGVKKAKLGTGDFFLTDIDKKHFYRDFFGIGAFDMETAAIASVCSDCEVPFLSLRSISDTADDAAVNSYRKENEMKKNLLSEIILNIIKKSQENEF